MVLPIVQEKEVMALAQAHGLLLHRYTKVRGNATAPFKRMLIELGRVEQTALFDELTLEVTRHQRTLNTKPWSRPFIYPKLKSRRQNRRKARVSVRLVSIKTKLLASLSLPSALRARPYSGGCGTPCAKKFCTSK